MAELDGYTRMAQFLKLTDRMIADASRETLEDVARILAAHVGHYRRRFGDLPIDESVDLLTQETLTDEQAGWIAEGLEQLAVALATVAPQDAPPSVQ